MCLSSRQPLVLPPLYRLLAVPSTARHSTDMRLVTLLIILRQACPGPSTNPTTTSPTKTVVGPSLVTPSTSRKEQQQMTVVLLLVTIGLCALMHKLTRKWWRQGVE